MRTLSLIATAVIVLSASASQAREQLWSERAGSSRLLAQVPDFAALAKQVVPAVVAIQVEQKVKLSRGGGGGRWKDPFEYFFQPFGGEIPHEFRNRGLGSGLVIRADGLILTNYHVVENADSIEITFALPKGGERKMSAKVLGTAPEYDVALVKTNEDAKVPVAYLGNSDAVNIGDWVMAVGNPFGLTHSVSVGIISAKERRDIMPSGRRGLYDFLQTDASINPGNSGGPLINMKGEVIGINSAINAAGSGIGFAIPINMVKDMLPDLKAKGKFTRSWIGIRIQPLTVDLAESYGLKKAEGALVSEVVANSPAERAGLKGEDVVVEFDGKPVRTSSDLPLYASMAGVNNKVKLKVWRKGNVRTVYVTLSEFPDEEVSLATGRPTEAGELGMTVADITPALERHFDLAVSRGVVVKEVEPGSISGRARLRPGDVVLTLNGKRTVTARDFAERVRKLKRGAVMRLQVMRGSGRLFVAVRKP
ncbi:Do family serine endopeptidase [Myxococcota bacterium]